MLLALDRDAVRQFSFLAPLALWLKRAQQACSTCKPKPIELPENLYAAALAGVEFNAQASRLAGWMGADLLVPGRTEPVRSPAA